MERNRRKNRIDQHLKYNTVMEEGIISDDLTNVSWLTSWIFFWVSSSKSWMFLWICFKIIFFESWIIFWVLSSNQLVSFGAQIFIIISPQFLLWSSVLSFSFLFDVFLLPFFFFSSLYKNIVQLSIHCVPCKYQMHLNHNWYCCNN